MEENFLKEYSALLDESNKHLSFESISRYANLNELLSWKEKDFVKKHLKECSVCSKKFNVVFDEDFEFDEEAIRFDGLILQKNAVNSFQITHDEFEIEIYKKGIENVLVFNLLSDRLKNCCVRLLSGDKTFLRLTDAKEKIEYQISHFDKPSEIKNIKLEFLQGKDQKKTDSKNFNVSYYWYAAAAIILVALGLAYFLPKESVMPENKKREIVLDTAKVKNNIIQNDSVEIPVKKNNEKLIAYNLSDFEENKILENFIDRNIRSSSTIKIISPEIGDTIKTPHVFKWEKIKEASEYSVIILSNKNKKVAEINSAQNFLQVSKELSPGLYYWKLEAEGKLRAVGKFFVK
ncbi:MAG: hypothetical protein ABI550_05475 [Ignavibacteriaceae bacterium]